jgi:hypothetical protein
MKKIYYLFFVVVLFGCSKTIETVKVEQPITGSGSVNLLSIELVSEDTISISTKYVPKVKTHYSNGFTNVVSLDSLSITSSDNTVFLSNKTYYGSKSGKAHFEIKFKDVTIKDTVYVSEIEEVDLTTLPFLTSPSNPNAKIIIPVVVVNYYPTLNGVDIDTKRAPGLGTSSPITIQNLKNRTIDYLTLTKFGLEEGSKFRGYNNPSQSSNVSFKIVKYVNVYELKRGLKDKQDVYMSAQDKLTPVYQPDYYDVFNKINLQSLVEGGGVKEVWFSLRPISSEYPVVRDSLSNGITAANFLNLPESNMSSPLGDVSNSYRMTNDLPVYNKTYVVYGYNLETGPANNIHNRGHQIEAQMSHLDARFWGSYSNPTDGYADSTHIGCTHKPPNTTRDYDWNNKTLTLSDIEDWKPTGGTKKLINSDRWINLRYNIPTLISGYRYDEGDPQYKWLLYWMQNIPSFNNGITGVSDWWDLFYNWDDAVRNRKRLVN